ncbi:hypothetical protein Tco_1485004 [Tanacetum coccineum]
MKEARSFNKQAGCDLFSWSWLHQQMVLFLRWKKIPAGLLDSTEGRDHRTLTLKITCSCLNGVDEDLTNLAKVTDKVQTVNGVRQIQALVDKKRVIVIESSIRRDLYLDDAEGIDCVPSATIFEELARMGRITPLFDTMMVQPVEEMGEDSDHPTDSTPIPIIDQPSSSSQPKKHKSSKKAQRQEAEVPQDEAEHEESVPTPSNDPQPSGEDSMQLTNFMILCTKLQTQVLDLQKEKDAQAKEIAALKKRI